MKKPGKRKTKSGDSLHYNFSSLQQEKESVGSDKDISLIKGFSAVTLQHLHKIFTSFILFDWEFFNNELEFE